MSMARINGGDKEVALYRERKKASQAASNPYTHSCQIIPFIFLEHGVTPTKMADEFKDVRILERLKVKIGEAKNLPPRQHGSSPLRDIYCTLSLDQEEIYRTATVLQNLAPFFMEEFQFEVPRTFRFISIYLYDRDRHLKQDKVLGKVAIRRENLASYGSKDHWFPIKAVDADSEVQGKVNIEIRFETNPGGYTRNLIVRVVECKDLTLRNGSCDPFAQINVLYSNNRTISKRTKTRKKTTNPQFEEEFKFLGCSGDNSTVDGDAEICELHVSIWHETAGMGENVFLGEVKVLLRGIQQQNAAHRNAWYFLQPRSPKNRPFLAHSTPPGTRLSSDNSLGSIRLQICYDEDEVFPASVYEKFKNLILDSIEAQNAKQSAVYLLGDFLSKGEIAQPLVRIFLHYEKIVPAIIALANAEIADVTDPTTIFRGNTLASKMMDEAMKLIGLQYLHKTLRPSLELIFSEKKPCEIDPTRVRDSNQIHTNRNNLISYIQRIFRDITQSAVNCPALMCQLFYHLKECARKRFPDDPGVRYSAISGFIFLRFFAPAILGPKLFDLTNEPIDSQMKRTLTLISKTIQSLGNLVSCRSSQQIYKEEYMECLYTTFYTEENRTAMKQFLEIICTNISQCAQQPPREHDMPVTLKEGHMIKRAQGRRPFGKKNFKKRYFKLTTHDLSYSKSRGRDALCRIPLTDILAVERLEETSFKKKNMFQIVQPQRALYVQAANCVEEKEWVDLLTKICLTNQNRLKKYHPSAFINGQWQCCKSPNELAQGCNEVSRVDSNNYHMTLDPERDLQRIHSLIYKHYQAIETFTELSRNQPAIYNILKQMMEITHEIEHKHRTYKRMIDRNIRYGSLAAPIGDDNYLYASRMNLDTKFKICSG